MLITKSIDRPKLYIISQLYEFKQIYTFRVTQNNICRLLISRSTNTQTINWQRDYRTRNIARKIIGGGGGEGNICIFIL